MELKITLLGGPYIKGAKSTWAGSERAAKPKGKYYRKNLGSFTLKRIKNEFVLTPQNKEYLNLRQKADLAQLHVRGIKIDVKE